MPTTKALEEINKYNLKIQFLRDQLTGNIDSVEDKYISKKIIDAESKRAELINFGISTREKNNLVKEAMSTFIKLETVNRCPNYGPRYIGYSKTLNTYVDVAIRSYSQYFKGPEKGKDILNNLSFISAEEYTQIIEEKNSKKLAEMRARMDSHRTYVEGSQHRYYGSSTTYNCVPGLFVYSGFGGGDYYSIDGNIYACSTSEASDMAKLEQVEWKNIDSFAHYSTVYVGD